MNKVVISGVIKFNVEIKTSKNGKKYARNVLTVFRNNGKGFDDIPFVAYDDEALLLEHAVKGSTVELSGEFRSNYYADKKRTDYYCHVQEVNIQEIEPPVYEQEEAPLEEMPDDDLPF